MTELFTARTVEEAKALAVKHFGVLPSEIQFEVIEEPRKGIFGFGKKLEAKVRATVAIPEPKRAVKNTELTPAPMSLVEESVPVVENSTSGKNSVEDKMESAPVVETSLAVENSTSDKPSVEDKTESALVVENSTSEETPVEDRAVSAPNEETGAEEKRSPRKRKHRHKKKKTASNPDDEEQTANATTTATVKNTKREKPQKTSLVLNPEDIEIEALSDEDMMAGEPSEDALVKVQIAKEYLAQLLSSMGVSCELEERCGERAAMLEICTQQSGMVIGKRGDTLDALQYLTFTAANHGSREYYRILLDTANYRERRRRTLEDLAERMAKRAIKNGRSVPLEPMTPYERRIIHGRISELEGVSSRSTGEEPHRKVIIDPDVKRGGSRRNDHRDNQSDSRYGNRHGKGKNTQNKPKERKDDPYRDKDYVPQRTSMDFMKTSFEVEYERTRPEDELNAGLYGKIEL